MALSDYQLPTEIRLVLVGKTGVGKSMTGNLILNNTNYFRYGCDVDSITRFCKYGSNKRFGTLLHIVDTPGVFDPHISNDKTQDEIKRCVGLITPGPHAFLLCVKMGRVATTDRQALDHLIRYFGQKWLKFVIVVFTFLDQWEADQEEREVPQTKEEYVAHLNPELSIFMNSCKNRYVFFNNRLKGAESDRQVLELLEKVKEVLADNENGFYTMDTYNKINEIPEEDQTFMDKFKQTTLSFFNK